jgi:hypothetical protein
MERRDRYAAAIPMATVILQAILTFYNSGSGEDTGKGEKDTMDTAAVDSCSEEYSTDGHFT